MVRIDKIIYMITHFKSLSRGSEESDYCAPPKNFKFNENALTAIKRFGIISGKPYSGKIEDKFLSCIPFGREVFLSNSLANFCKNTCLIDNPKCFSCSINEKCDYHNKKNDWEIEN